MFSVPDFDDYSHILDSNQHEAFYFQFTSPNGLVSGFLRTLFGPSTVLEIVALNVEGRAWVFQRGSPLIGAPGPAYEASGPALKLLCLQPWAEWRSHFDYQLSDVTTGQRTPFKFDMRFHSTGPATRYYVGPYQQVQQDGVLTGSFTLGSRDYTGVFSCSRDHSWGQRQMHIARDWRVASLPTRMYLAVIYLEAESRPMHFGHFFSSADQRQVFQSPLVAVEGNGWRIQDAATMAGTWRVQRIVQPFVMYLGPPGQEALRLTPRPGDLYRDEVGPAVYMGPDGRQHLGFFEHARRIT